MFSKGLVPLNLPDAPLKLAKKDGDVVVWDEIRKKYLKLTPEEWVRQHFMHFLFYCGYPRSAFSLEGGFRLNEKLKRTDILVYKDSKPAFIIECKAPQVRITQEVFDQAARYNMVHKTSLIAVTNGHFHFIVRVDHERQTYDFLEELPPFDKI